MIKIIGATGNLGSAVIEELKKLQNISEIGAIGRNPEKLKKFSDQGIKTFVADLNDVSSCELALSDCDTLLLVSANEIGSRIKQHINAIDAAKKAGVKQIVYTSFIRKTETSENALGQLALEHVGTEKYILESGLKYTIVRNNLYSDMFGMFLGDCKNTGDIFFPAGDGKVGFASRSEMAAAIAQILINLKEDDNRIYNFSGDKALSFNDIAKITSEITGREIVYKAPDLKTFVETMKSGGVDDATIGFMAMFGKGIAEGEFDKSSDDIDKLLGRKQESYAEFLKKVL